LIIIFIATCGFAQNADSTAVMQQSDDTVKQNVSQEQAVKISPNKITHKPHVVRSENISKSDRRNSVTELNIWSLIYILVLILVGYVFSNLLSLSKKLWIYKKYPVLNSLLIYIKTLVWIIVLYLIISLLSGQVSNILLGLIILVFVFVSVAALRFLQNIVGGIYLNITNPFQKGDFIRIEKYEGEVQKIELRTTTIISETNSMISIPNSLFLSVPVINVNRGQVEQLLTLDFEFPFEYPSSKIIKIVYEAALSSPYTFTKYKPKVYFRNSDFQKKTRSYQLQVFVFDGKYENELIHNLNLLISNSIENSFAKQR
jgi:small conductance mechanosensitive channel